MIDSKAIAEAMDVIVKRAERLSSSSNVDGDGAYEIGIIVGTAKAVQMQCEHTGKPTMRGAAE